MRPRARWPRPARMWLRLPERRAALKSSTTRSEKTAAARHWCHSTSPTSTASPGLARRCMRATVFPGEDPLTLDTPDQAAQFILPMCAPAWTETGKLYDYPTRTLLDFRAPG